MLHAVVPGCCGVVGDYAPSPPPPTAYTIQQLLQRITEPSGAILAGNNSSTVTTPIVAVAPSADISISKSGPASIVAGGSIAYTIVVSNNGPDAAANVVVTDPTPAGLVFVGNAGACASAYPCAIGALASGASATITSMYSVPSDFAGSNPIVNSAAAGSDTPDPNGNNNVGSVSTSVTAVTASADLGIVKSGPASATSGDLVSYTVVVTNHGPDAVSDAVLSDPTPAGLVFVGASTPCASGFPCAFGALGNGASVTIEATYRVSPDFTGEIANVASVASPTVPDPTPGDNSGTATTVVNGSAPPVANVPVPLDARWMLALMGLLLMLAGASRAVRRGR
jgi:uncharacterized repeat protein (TIGR01451 family)